MIRPSKAGIVFLTVFARLCSLSPAVALSPGQARRPPTAIPHDAQPPPEIPPVPPLTRMAGDRERRPLTVEPSARRKLMLTGTVTSVDGEAIGGAKVWLAFPDTPSKPLTEVESAADGRFTLELETPGQPADPGEVLVGVAHPDYMNSLDLMNLAQPASTDNLGLLMRKQASGYDEPDLDVLAEWLLPHFKRPSRCRTNPSGECAEFASALAGYKKEPVAWTVLSHALDAAHGAELPEAQLMAGLLLMRHGAWEQAGRVIRTAAQENPGSPDIWLLEGFYWNLLHRPAQAIPCLERASELRPNDLLADLELGRAALAEEDWATALERVEPVLRNRKLAPYARYLRARSLMAQGDVEGAEREAKALPSRERRNPSPDVQALSSDIRNRLDARSAQPLGDLLTEPIAAIRGALPSLRDLDSGAPPPAEGFDKFLDEVGQNVERFFRNFSNTAATEDVRQVRLGKRGKLVSERSQEFYYVFLHGRGRAGNLWIEEYRGTNSGQPEYIGGLGEGFMVTSGFASTQIIFHPAVRPGIRFRFLGRQSVAGQGTYVIAFAQRAEDLKPLGFFHASQGGGGVPLYLQGIAWISADRLQVLRLHTDLLHEIPQVHLTREATEIDYRPYHFLNPPTTLLLPSYLTVAIDWNGRHLRNEHIFSKFHIFKVETSESGLNAVGGPSEEPKNPSPE